MRSRSGKPSTIRAGAHRGRATAPTAHAPNPGFTLLEVLAAIALLGVVYTPLARVATQWLSNEGESRRRLEASLIADRELSRIETGLNAGVAPEVGTSNQESDPFSIHRTISEFRPPYVRDKGDPPNRGDAPLPTLFPAPNSREPSALRKIEIRVSWFEAENEREVVRTTFGFDVATASAMLLTAQGNQR